MLMLVCACTGKCDWRRACCVLCPGSVATLQLVLVRHQPAACGNNICSAWSMPDVVFVLVLIFAWLCCRYNMHEREQEVEALQSLTQIHLTEWYRQHFLPGCSMRRRLAVHIVGRTHASEMQSNPAGLESVPDLESFKSRMPFHEPADGLL